MDKHYTLAKFLQEAPLYQKVAIDKWFDHPQKFAELPFQFYCPIEKRNETFKLAIEPRAFVDEVKSRGGGRDYLDLLYYRKGDVVVNFIHFFSGECQFCHRYKVHFLLNVFSEVPIPILHPLT